MKLFSYGKDGGSNSVVWGFWLIEIKSFISIVMLCFENGSREAYHNHAFNSISWVLKGQLKEVMMDGDVKYHKAPVVPIIVTREDFHQVHSVGRTWVFSLRGKWKPTGQEYLPSTNEVVTLTNGRKILNRQEIE